MSFLGSAPLPPRHQAFRYVREERRNVWSETRIHHIHSRYLKNTYCSIHQDRSQSSSQCHGPFLTKPSLTLKFLRNLSLSILFLSTLLTLFLALSLLRPDFSHRWHQLVVINLDGEDEEDETRTPHINSSSMFKSNGAVLRKTVASISPSDLPSHLWQAVVASEDRRFFEHCGIDPVSISRAALSFSAAGGGSTITQQLVKNVFLKNERKWERKVIEAMLALILESKISKWKILWSYLTKIYWGHGTYGIEAASSFYFGKHPSLLSLGESAMLAGIIPAPEILSPLKHPSRGKKPQARVLRRMVESGFLDIDTALRIVNQPLCLHVDGLGQASRLWHSPYLAKKILLQLPIKKGEKVPSVWERSCMGESSIIMRKLGLRGRSNIGGDEECYSSKLQRFLVELRAA